MSPVIRVLRTVFDTGDVPLEVQDTAPGDRYEFRYEVSMDGDSGRDAASGPLRVGACLSLSGRYARFGSQAARALQAWAATSWPTTPSKDPRPDNWAVKRHREPERGGAGTPILHLRCRIGV